VTASLRPDDPRAVEARNMLPENLHTSDPSIMAYEASPSVIRRLEEQLRISVGAEDVLGPVAPLAASVSFLRNGRASLDDLRRLWPLAATAGLCWAELWPELLA